MKKSFWDKVGSALFQFVLLVIGVWLALKANDWSENRKSRIETQQLLEKLEAEIDFNISRVDGLETYYAKLRDSLNVNIPKEYRKEGSVQFYNFWFGKIAPRFQEYVFDLALNTGKMNDLDLDLAMSLMRLKSQQNEFTNNIEVYDQEGWRDMNTLERMNYLTSLVHDVFLQIDAIRPILDESKSMVIDRRNGH